MEPAGVNDKVVERGKSLFANLPVGAPTVLNKAWWTGKVLEASMACEDFKVELFRFADDLPMITSAGSLARDLAECIGDAEKNIPAGGPDYLAQFMKPRVVTENTMRPGVHSRKGRHGPGVSPNWARPGSRSSARCLGGAAGTTAHFEGFSATLFFRRDPFRSPPRGCAGGGLPGR